MTEPTPLIACLRRAYTFLRVTAAVVAVTFTMLVLAPSATAAREAMEQASDADRAPSRQSDAAALAQTLQLRETRLARLAERLDSGADSQALERLARRLERLDARVRTGFEHIGAELRERALPSAIRERREATVAAYSEQIEALRDDLAAIEASEAPEQRAARARRAERRLESRPSRRAQQPFDPENLPTRALEADPDNTPKLDPAAFRQSGLFDTPYPTVAALGEFRIDTLVGADDPAYLGESDEIVLTDTIRAKAAELDHDPVAIHHWVRNQIAWDPGWGAVQDAELTLGAGRGNAMDIAGLTIALLRASGIPARYVHGTIEVREDRFRNWAGGFSDIGAAADFAASTGMPIATRTSAGRIAAVRMEHVWIEAAIDFYPSRGAVNRAANTWVPLDPSFKQSQYQEGLDAIAIAGIDPEALAQAFLDSGEIDGDEGWVSGFDPTILQAAQEQAQETLEQYIDANLPEATVGDVIGGRRTIVEDYSILPAALPNKIIARGARYDHLPESLQQQITWTLNDGASMTLPYAKVNNRRVTLSFTPATEADEETLSSLLPEGEITDISQLPESIPAYLIQVIPEIRLDGEPLAQGTSLTLGTELRLSTRIAHPGVSSVDTGERQRHRQFNFQVGVLISFLEYAVPEQMFSTKENPAEAISAVKAWQIASQQGQGIYYITQMNMDALLPNISRDAITMAEIREALATGNEVLTHARAVDISGWNGSGYVILEPNSALGAWKIRGSRNGGYYIFVAESGTAIAGLAEYVNLLKMGRFLRIVQMVATGVHPYVRVALAFAISVAAVSGLIAGDDFLGFDNEWAAVELIATVTIAAPLFDLLALNPIAKMFAVSFLAHILLAELVVLFSS